MFARAFKFSKIQPCENKVLYHIHVCQWCANPGFSNPNPDPNPDTSNPNPAESESTPFFLNPNPNPNPIALNPNPDSNPAGHTSPQEAARFESLEVSFSRTSKLYNPFFPYAIDMEMTLPAFRSKASVYSFFLPNAWCHRSGASICSWYGIVWDQDSVHMNISSQNLVDCPVASPRICRQYSEDEQLWPTACTLYCLQIRGDATDLGGERLFTDF